jgi:hypothetical protein
LETQIMRKSILITRLFVEKHGSYQGKLFNKYKFLYYRIRDHPVATRLVSGY